MYKKSNDFNLYELLLKNNNVNYYTKMIILLNTLNFYEDYYIPNKKLMKMLKIDKKNTIRILKQLEKDKIIYLIYKGRKRFFSFRINTKEENFNKVDLYDYNWLDDPNF